MIIESPAALRLVAALTEIGAVGTTREHLIKKADISTSSFYRLIGPLIEAGLVKVDGSRYSLVFESLYCFRFKLWHDMERLYRLSTGERDMALGVASTLLAQFQDRIRCLWLVGSGARAELETGSDLDFLLVTNQEEGPIAGGIQPRQVNVIQMSAEHFRDSYRQADAFVVSALQNGIILFDSGFAQPFYVSPPPVRISPSHARAQEAANEQYRELLLRELKDGDIEAAQRMLRHQGTSAGLLLLRAMDVLPDNRRQLIQESESRFGKVWAQTLASALGSPPTNKTEIVSLSRRIAEQEAAFRDQGEHLQRFAALPAARGRILESLGQQVFAELIPDGRVVSEDREVALHIDSSPGLSYLIEFKSTPGLATDDWLRSSVRLLERAKRKLGGVAHLILVTNPHTKLPPSESATIQRAMYVYKTLIFKRLAPRDIRDRLIVLSGLQLLSAHNRYHLEDLAPLQVLSELLDEGRETASNIELVAEPS